jgi:hypothetical protein
MSTARSAETLPCRRDVSGRANYLVGRCPIHEVNYALAVLLSVVNLINPGYAINCNEAERAFVGHYPTTIILPHSSIIGRKEFGGKGLKDSARAVHLCKSYSMKGLIRLGLFLEKAHLEACCNNECSKCRWT